jgi:drug/metabolite transporter (DMT)-like permease
LLAFAISLASGLSWGVSDFLGGLQSRRMPVLVVLAVSQPFGLVLALMAVGLFGADPVSAGDLAIAFGAGAASLGGLGAFYAAMAGGTISVVAPIAALGVVVPVAAGLAGGEQPGALQFAGLVVATSGVVMLGYEESPEHASVGRRPILLAFIAALGFGIFFTGLDAAAPANPGWAVVSVRVGGVAATVVALIVVRPRFDAAVGAVPVLLAIGAFDVLANTMFAVASTKGLLPVVAVGGSTYPAFTVALAHIVLGERLAVAQRAGVALALAGVLLIASGT